MIIEIDIKDIPFRFNTPTPILTHCRRLVDGGIDPQTTLVVYREGVRILAINGIGKGAELTVEEEPCCHFKKYRKPVFDGTY